MGKIYKIYSASGDKVRSEYVDTSKNILFKRAKNAGNVKNVYEAFWEGSSEKVHVLKVKPVNIKSHGANWGIKLKKMV